MMKLCPKCKLEFGEQVVFCPYDGTILVSYSVIDGKYRLEEKVGEGGMGQVYRATHIHIGTTLAVKLLNANLVSDQLAVERFRREARAAAQIHHPNAVAVTDFGFVKDVGLVYLVMEFLEGITLTKKLRHKGRLDCVEAFVILQQICMAVQVAHNKGIVHRDLKPDNIFIVKTEEGGESVKVLDFGIAKLMKKSNSMVLTEAGIMVGTPHYMSPEQCKSGELDSRSDIYSLGIILYELLTGTVPFTGNTPFAVVLMQTTEAPKPVRVLCPEIPPPVERVVMRALAKRPEERQQSALELVTELELALNAAGIILPLVIIPKSEPLPPSPKPMPDDEPIRPDEPDRPEPAWRNTIFSISSSTRIADGNRLKYIVFAILLFPLLGGIYWSRRPSVPKVRYEPSETTAMPTPPPLMIFVPGGKFIMGNNNSAEETEKPEHEVTVKPFFIDQYEVTNEEYEKFVKEKNYLPPPHWPNGQMPAKLAILPVTNVTWFDAKAYAIWAGKRLPTEEEWELAARGADKRLYPWGTRFDETAASSAVGKKRLLLPVGSLPAGASPFKVMDMAGNVAEWTDSSYHLYPGSKATPKPGTKVVRGGSYLSDRFSVMTTARFPVDPKKSALVLGFRCVKDINFK